MEKSKFHVGLNVSNMDETISFYSRLFGQKPVKIEPGYCKFELDNPELVISFIESENSGPQFGHFGIRVNDDEELGQKKAELRDVLKIELEEENASCCYAVQNKFWVKDPDGYEWEVYHFLKDDHQKGGRQEKEKIGVQACC